MLFMTAPKERAFERMMQQLPRYRWPPPKADYYIGTYARYLQQTNTPTTENTLTIAAESTPWPILVMSIAEVFANPQFTNRAYNHYLKEEHYMTFTSLGHQLRFQSAMMTASMQNRIGQSALYLLTADRGLWDRVKRHITAEGIHFGSMHINGCSTDEYALFCAAKDLYHCTRHITISDMTDPTVISGMLFRLICNAMTIARYGIKALKD
ncbi:hypothetical protein [Paenibacillus sp.]